MSECPVCGTKCPDSTIKCEICDFYDENGIARPIATLEEAQYRLETFVKPHRQIWEFQKKNDELQARLIQKDDLIAQLQERLQKQPKASGKFSIGNRNRILTINAGHPNDEREIFAILKFVGYRISATVAQKKDLIREYNRHKEPDLFIIGDNDAVQTIKIIKMSSQAIPIIVFANSRTYEQELLKAGATVCMPKPLKADVVLETIKKLLA